MTGKKRKSNPDKESDFIDQMQSDALQAKKNGKRVGIYTLINKTINKPIVHNEDNQLIEQTKRILISDKYQTLSHAALNFMFILKKVFNKSFHSSVGLIQKEYLILY
ncbi:MAG TPA: hypothetical protein PK624_11510 [Spirochaetota bacterium]|nr:hypothetical protein [Spirochaetota bacterium]HPK57116.1 hypothetical protein [Spirochaetota bacterium]